MTSLTAAGVCSLEGWITNRNQDKEVFFGGKYPFYYNLLNILVPLYFFHVHYCIRTNYLFLVVVCLFENQMSLCTKVHDFPFVFNCRLEYYISQSGLKQQQAILEG